MDGTSIIIGIIIALFGGVGILSFVKNQSIRDIFKSNNNSDPIEGVEYEEEPISIEEPPMSSNKNLKKLGKALLNMFGKSSLIIITALNLYPTTKKEAISNYIKMTEKYVELTESEFESLRYNKDNTNWKVRIIDDGSKIKATVVISINQPFISSSGDVSLIPSTPIIRTINIKPKMRNMYYRNGIHLYTGILLGITYNINNNIFEPSLGFELISYYINAIAISTFPLVSINSWGVGMGVGPSMSPNLRGYVSATKRFITSEINFGVGVAAIVSW